MRIQSMTIVAALAMSNMTTDAATTSNPTFYSGLADQPSLYSTFSASSLHTKYFSYWEGLAGGEVKISLEDGEFISSVSIDLAISNNQALLESTNYLPQWTLVLGSSYPEAGNQPGEQIWKVAGNYGSTNWFSTGQYYIDSNRQPLFLKARFEVATNYGVTTDDNGGLGYRYSIIPEPSTTLLTSLTLIAIIKRRRTPRRPGRIY